MVTSCIALGAAPGLGTTPQFFNTSPSTTIVNLNAGQNSFSVTGFASDAEATHTVSFFTVGRPSFMSFEYTPGNPGSFRLYAQNLTGANYGGYRVDVIATDNATPTQNLSSKSFNIGVVPEPTLLAGCLVTSIAKRKRRGAR